MFVEFNSIDNRFAVNRKVRWIHFDEQRNKIRKKKMNIKKSRGRQSNFSTSLGSKTDYYKEFSTIIRLLVWFFLCYYAYLHLQLCFTVSSIYLLVAKKLRLLITILSDLQAAKSITKTVSAIGGSVVASIASASHSPPVTSSSSLHYR